jgi:ABC-type sugar transport system ATPase subunit
VILDGVSRRFGDHVALDRVSVTVEPGELVAIIGRSGAGKTTLIRCLSRSLVATEGVIRCGGQDVRTLRGAALRAHRAQIGVIYQQFNLVKRLRVLDNVLVGRLPHLRGWRRWASLGGYFGANDRELATRCLDHYLWDTIRSFNDREAATVILMIVAMVMCIDVVSSRIRRAAILISQRRVLMRAFFMMEMGVDPKKHFSRLTFSGSHEASILAVANKKVEVASTNLGDLQQLTREGKVPRGGLRVVWVSKLIPNDPIVVRKDLPASLRSAIQESLTTMRARNPEVFKEAGATIGGFVPADDGKYQVIRDLNETAKRLAAQK